MSQVKKLSSYFDPPLLAKCHLLSNCERRKQKRLEKAIANHLVKRNGAQTEHNRGTEADFRWRISCTKHKFPTSSAISHGIPAATSCTLHSFLLSPPIPSSLRYSMSDSPMPFIVDNHHGFNKSGCCVRSNPNLPVSFYHKSEILPLLQRDSLTGIFIVGGKASWVGAFCD